MFSTFVTPAGCNGNFGYPTQCSVCCKPYYGNRDCFGILCAYSPCLHVVRWIKLQKRRSQRRHHLCHRSSLQPPLLEQLILIGLDFRHILLYLHTVSWHQVHKLTLICGVSR